MDHVGQCTTCPKKLRSASWKTLASIATETRWPKRWHIQTMLSTTGAFLRKSMLWLPQWGWQCWKQSWLAANWTSPTCSNTSSNEKCASHGSKSGPSGGLVGWDHNHLWAAHSSQHHCQPNVSQHLTNMYSLIPLSKAPHPMLLVRAVPSHLSCHPPASSRFLDAWVAGPWLGIPSGRFPLSQGLALALGLKIVHLRQEFSCSTAGTATSNEKNSILSYSKYIMNINDACVGSGSQNRNP